MTKSSQYRHNQRGMVSILVTMVLMIIISLITIGFARLVRREQRQSLDAQLSTQAFYAAESGINDAVDALQNQNYTSEKTNCGPDPSGPLSAGSNVLDSSNGIEYTCLLIDPSPTSLDYSVIEQDKATTIPIKAGSGNINKIVLSWQDTSGDTGASCTQALGSFPAIGSWPSGCDAGMLRIDLVPTGGNVSRSNLLSSVLSAVLQPLGSGGGSLAYILPASQGTVAGGTCSSNGSPKLCSLTITGLNASNYYLHVRSIYKDNSLNIVAKDSADKQLELIDAQAVVDSTGKANDVLRRIVVRVPIGDLSKGDVPDYAIQSGDTICKRMAVAPGIAPIIDSSDTACQIN